MDKPKCETCAHSFGEIQNDLQRKIECRRKPPTAHILPTHEGVIVQTMFPPVTAQTWCGEYRRDLALLDNVLE